MDIFIFIIIVICYGLSVFGLLWGLPKLFFLFQWSEGEQMAGLAEKEDEKDDLNPSHYAALMRINAQLKEVNRELVKKLVKAEGGARPWLAPLKSHMEAEGCKLSEHRYWVLVLPNGKRRRFSTDEKLKKAFEELYIR